MFLENLGNEVLTEIGAQHPGESLPYKKSKELGTGIAPRSCSGKAEWFPFEFLQSSLALRVNLHEFTHHSLALPQACKKCNGKCYLCQGRCCTLKAPDVGGYGEKRGETNFLIPFPHSCILVHDGLGLPQKRTCLKNVCGPCAEASQLSSEQRSSSWRLFTASTQGHFLLF